MQLKGLTGTYRRHCVVTELNKFKGGISVAEVMELAEALSVNTILTDLSLESNLEEGAGLSIGRAPPLSLLLGQALVLLPRPPALPCGCRRGGDRHNLSLFPRRFSSAEAGFSCRGETYGKEREKS